MKALLDTHVLLWWVLDDDRLSPRAAELLSDAGSELYFSAASAWELSIKAQLGRLRLPESPDRFLLEQLRQNRIAELPVSIVHALHVLALPPHHRDPFDRLLVAQSRIESLPLVTADPLISRYQVETIW